MKTLVVYYSYEGNTEFIANVIANHLKADKLKLEPQNEKKVSGFMKYIWGGKQVFARIKPALTPFDKNPADYDALIIGTPVWAWTYAPALETFLTEYKVKSKKVALFCCHQGAKGNVFKNMRQRLSSNDIIGEADFIDPLSHDKDKNANLARQWVEGLGLAGKG